MKIICMMFLLFLSNICIAQINIEYLNDVPAEFKEKYYSQKRDYNPLQVGNMWQYYYEDNNEYWTTKIVKDSTINGKQYFKKIYYEVNPPTRNFVVWERNDTVSGVSFMLDFEDVNKNGDFSEELPVDSLENPYWSRYITYKYSFNDPFFWSGEKSVLVKDTNWIRIEGDTVISRFFEIEDIFWGEEIADKFGILLNLSESPNRFCNGAIINGRRYGTIVGIDEEDFEQNIPVDFILGNNFPNPFNPTTKIRYSIKESGKVKLVAYDSIGRRIAVLVSKEQPAGKYEVTFNTRDYSLSSGIYYYQLIHNDNYQVRKMLLLH